MVLLPLIDVLDVKVEKALEELFKLNLFNLDCLLLNYENNL